MKKEKKTVFGREVFLLGVRKEDKKKVWLVKQSFDCGWYWGFGYIQTYINNKTPELSRDICDHQHFDSTILNGDSHGFNNFKNYFEFTPLTDGEIWELCDYMKTFYTLKETAEVFGRGYSYYTEKAKIEIIKNEEIANKINKEMLPVLFENIEKLLTLEV